MKTYLIILSFFAACLNVSGQEWKDAQSEELRTVFTKLSSKLRKPDTKFLYTREVYRHFSDDKPLSQSNGLIIIGKDGKYRSESDGEMVIQNENVKFILDTANHKAIIVTTDTLFKSVDPEQLLNGASLENFTYRMRKTDKGTVYQINPVDVSTAQSVEIWLDSEEDLQKMIVFMPEGNYFSESLEDESTELPKVILSFKKPVSCFPEKDGSLDISQWVTFVKGHYELTPKYSTTYQFDDLRYEPKN